MLALFLAFANAALFAVNAEFVLKPRDTEAVVGDSTYFDCASNVNGNQINWYRYAVGAKDHEDICIYCLGKIHPLYENRIQLERYNTGNSRLRIKSVQLEDAGSYVCQDNGGIGESASAQLVVLESSPTCTSNIKPDGLLGANSCNIEPDELHLSCSVSYIGNIPPIIKWRDMRTVDPSDKGFSCQNTGNRMTCILTMKTDLSMNGASYICETKKSPTTQYNCTSDIIRIIYAKTGIAAEEAMHGSGDKVKCSNNNSETCSFLWKWFDGVEEDVVSNNSILTPLKIGWHKCEANCNIRGKHCTVLSKVVHVSEAKDRDILMWSLVTCLAIVVILSFGMFFMIRRRFLNPNVSSGNKQPLLRDPSRTNTAQLDVFRINSTAAYGQAIYGLAILEKNIFVLWQSSASVEVYDLKTLILKLKWNLEQMKDPWDIASCNINQCLYIVEGNGILRVDPHANGSVINKWSTGGAYGLLSVTKEANILLAVQFRHEVYEYSPEGQLLREIRLSESDIHYPRHVVKLTNERFLISFGSNYESPPGILVYDGEIIIASSGNSEGHQSQQLNGPMQMCVISRGPILVTDSGNSRVLQLNTALEFQKELVSSKDGLRCPFRMCLDESNGILCVANNSFDFDTLEKKGKILAFQII